MNLSKNELINALADWGKEIRSQESEFQEILIRAELTNPWFTRENMQTQLTCIVDQYLNFDNLTDWLKDYEIGSEPKSVGLIMAGNIPLVGFHDLLSVICMGHIAQVKLSTKDNILLPRLQSLIKHPSLKERIQIVDRLQNFDAVIATGSDNSSRYFESYFGKYPHIIRRNRSSVGIINPHDEKLVELEAFGEDIFTHFGLGCRNISMMWLPRGIDPAEILRGLEKYEAIKDHNKYRNNLDYQATIHIMEQINHLAAEYLILKESADLHSPLATLHYQHYDDITDVLQWIKINQDDIQCCVTTAEEISPRVEPGMTQKPKLDDYADNVNTLDFLQSL